VSAIFRSNVPSTNTLILQQCIVNGFIKLFSDSGPLEDFDLYLQKMSSRVDIKPPFLFLLLLGISGLVKRSGLDDAWNEQRES
jgi:hypothetical protein